MSVLLIIAVITRSDSVIIAVIEWDNDTVQPISVSLYHPITELGRVLSNKMQ